MGNRGDIWVDPPDEDEMLRWLAAIGVPPYSGYDNEMGVRADHYWIEKRMQEVGLLPVIDPQYFADEVMYYRHWLVHMQGEHDEQTNKR